MRERRQNRTIQKVNFRFPSLQGDNETYSSIKLESMLQESQNEMSGLIVPRNQDRSFKNYTMAQALKLRKLVKPEGEDLKPSKSKAFIPVNPFQAKLNIKRTIEYDFQNDPLNRDLSFQKSPDESFDNTQPSQSTLKTLVFKRSSPSPNHISAAQIKSAAQFQGDFSNHDQQFLEAQRVGGEVQETGDAKG